MPHIRAFFRTLLIAGLLLSYGAVSARDDDRTTACGTAVAPARNGLTAVQWGTIVYDSEQEVCWLADANLAGDRSVRARVPLSSVNPDGSAPLINADGTMDYQTALNWVAALNHYDNDKGWLGHHDWQLPTTAVSDPTCSSHDNGNFGVQCTGSALGHLYTVGSRARSPTARCPSSSPSCGHS